MEGSTKAARSGIISNIGTWDGTIIKSNNTLSILKNNKNSNLGRNHVV